MTSVKTKSSLLLTFVFILLCCKKRNPAGKEQYSQKDTTVYDYNNIVVNSEEEGFDFSLINTLPVRKKDTVLFRKWEVVSFSAIDLYHSKYTLKNSKQVYYYKTGKYKFSTYKLRLLDSLNNELLEFYSKAYYNHPEKLYLSEIGIYDIYSFSGYTRLSKINDTIGRLDLSRINTGCFFMDFKIQNGEIHIFKLMEKLSFFNNKGEYELDTLIIINNKNRFIEVRELYEATHKNKNMTKAYHKS